MDYSDEPKLTTRVLRIGKRERRGDVRMEEGARERSEGFYMAGFQEGGRSQEEHLGLALTSCGRKL